MVLPDGCQVGLMIRGVRYEAKFLMAVELFRDSAWKRLVFLLNSPSEGA